MSQLSALKSASTLADVAVLLNSKPSSVAYLLYVLAPALRYSSFQIAKRGGGFRTILAPEPRLKRVQRALSDLLQNCEAEILSTAGFGEESNSPDRIVHGFRRKRSIISNAREHRSKRFVLNVDIQDFFGSINFGRVRGFLIRDKNFGLQPAAATVIAQIACFNGSLPQGSPCSPVISNLIGRILDAHLIRLAEKVGCTYSRYADDLTFSTNRPEFPSALATLVGPGTNQWIPGHALSKLISECGFNLNPQKTRLQYRDSRQTVTGLVVNRKVNIPNDYRKLVRARVHRLVTTGSYQLAVPDGTGGETIEDGSPRQLRGMIGHIENIDGFNIELRDKAGKFAKPGDKKLAIAKHLRTYRRFLLYTEFYAAERPLILCEGKTDNIYLTHAIRKQHIEHPLLAAASASGKVSLKVRIFRYVATKTGSVLAIHGGTSDLAKFIMEYEKESKLYSGTVPSNPVILALDNDSGLAPIRSVVDAIKGLKGTILDPFVHVCANLYVCVTPKIAPNPESCMEDFFDAATKSKTLNGKTFDPKSEHDTSLYYGKAAFAHQVVVPDADSIDFSGFDPLLHQFESILVAHAAKPP